MFIEPKGKHLAGDDNDDWKETLLEEISLRYGLERITVETGSGYVLVGLPFFNAEDAQMKAWFEAEFGKLEE